MGILDDLAMAFGAKPRTEDYDARTARGVATNAAVGNAPQQMAGMITSTLNAGGTISPSSSMYKYLDKSAFSGSDDSGGYSGAQLFGEKSPAYNKYFTDRGYEAGYTPQVGSTALSGPKPYAIGPFTSANPIRLPGILGLITGGLFGQRDREVPTVSADGGAMRVRPSGYQPPYSTIPFEIGNSGAGMDYVTPAYTANYQAPYEIGNSGLGMDYVIPTRLTSVLDSEPVSLIPTPPSEEGLPELILPGVDDPTYEEFMEHQKELEAKMGFEPVSEAQYRTIYNRMLSK